MYLTMYRYFLKNIVGSKPTSLKKLIKNRPWLYHGRFYSHRYAEEHGIPVMVVFLRDRHWEAYPNLDGVPDVVWEDLVLRHAYPICKLYNGLHIVVRCNDW